MSDFDFNLLEELVKDAPSLGFGPRRNFGLLKMKVEVASWEGEKGSRKIKLRPFDNKPLAKGEYFQLTFTSELGEFNPAFASEYKRRVDVRKSGRKGAVKDPKNLADWEEIVEPALKAAFGKDYFKRLATKGAYCEWEDATTVELDKDGSLKGFIRKDRTTNEPILDEATGEPVRLLNTVPKVLRVFKSKADAAAAREEVYGSDSFGPSDDNGTIPDKVISDAAGILKALDNEDAARELFANTPPYSNYDLDELVAAASAK